MLLCALLGAILQPFSDCRVGDRDVVEEVLAPAAEWDAGE
jgi:hypothetical protein